MPGHVVARDGGVVSVLGGAIAGGLGSNGSDCGVPSVVNVSGGSVAGGLSASALAFVSGGEIAGDVTASGSGEIEISGGSIGGMLVALDDAEIRVLGGDFNHPLGAISDTSGTLTGVLADGTPIDVPFGRASSATILVPEPSPELVHLAALAGLLVVRAGSRLSHRPTTH
jgi:hypothetical protein